MSDKLGMAERSPALNVGVTRSKSPCVRVTRRTTLMRVVRITINSGHHNDLFLGDGWQRFDEVTAFVRRHRR